MAVAFVVIIILPGPVETFAELMAKTPSHYRYVCMYIVQPSFCIGQVIIIIIFFCKCGLIEKFAIRNSRLVRRVAFCFDFFPFRSYFVHSPPLQYHL